MTRTDAGAETLGEIAGHPVVRWDETDGGRVVLLDQTKLPTEVSELRLTTVEEVFEAIRRLSIRGAPAIGIAGAFGVALGAHRAPDDLEAVRKAARAATGRLADSRPTARNLFWALDRMERVAAETDAGTAGGLRAALLDEARTILREEVERCRAIGRHGARLVGDGDRVLTHCNAGGLATGGFGTALGVVYAAAEEGKALEVYADETRPLLQGARLTAFELAASGIDCTVICDGMVGALMQEGRCDLVVVGADRIARNGDTANKIGTYVLSVLAREHGVPFYVAAPTSTFDRDLASGEAIPIEERAADEVLGFGGVRTTPDEVEAWNPAFDVTPAGHITAIVTERGVIEEPTERRVLAHLDGDTDR